MAAFVHGTKGEGQAAAQQDQAHHPERPHQGPWHHQPRQRSTAKEQRPQQPTDQQHPEVEGQLQQAGSVAALVQLSQQACIKAFPL
jgi:hypothetical protein